MKPAHALRALGLLTLAATTGASLEADAASATRSACSVLSFEVDGSGTKSRLIIDAQCTQGRMTHIGYYGFTCGPSGVNASKETIEGWRSMAHGVAPVGEEGQHHIRQRQHRRLLQCHLLDADVLGA